MRTRLPHAPLLAAPLFAALGALGACTSAPFGIALRVVGEDGADLAEATVTVDGVAHAPGLDGLVRLGGLDRPVLALVSAPGHLVEPVPLGRDAALANDGPVEIRLLSDAGGARVVVHAGGDVMLGRRYLAPVEGDPLLTPGDGGASARAVVSDLAPAFGAADLTLVNLETVVGEFTPEEAYPGKRFLLLTPPEGVSALHELGADVAGLANNHQRDWMDVGVASTLDHLAAGGVPHLGAGLTEAEAALPLHTDVGELRVAVLAYTSVEGDIVNDQYPRDGEVPPEDAGWSWEARAWGSPEHGIPEAARRIGSAWEAIVEAEPGLDEDARAALWASAEAVYPELQDWVARRGHGGANFWHEPTATADIAAAREAADLVVVQLHMGFQFATVPGEGSRDAAHAAIEAGADLVVAHHPHVLQGLEWYRGKLIAWSLGNLVFDQDFLSTFRSAFLRTVWEDDGTLVEARLVPLFLDRYRPVPVADARARATLRTLWEASWDEALAERGSDLVVRSVAHTRVAGAEPVDLRIEHNTAALLLPGEAADTQIEIPATGKVSIAALPPVWRRLDDTPPTGVEVGRSLLGLGDFEDADTDADSDAAGGDPAGWEIDSADIRVTARAAADGRRGIELVRSPGDRLSVTTRTIARIPLAAHRLHADADGTVPLDGPATLSVHLDGWISGPSPGEEPTAQVRLDLYHFDDTDATADPESVFLRTITKTPALLPGRWTDTSVPLDAADLEPVDGLTPNAALLYLVLQPPETRTTLWRVDNVEVIEWRAAAEEPEGWAAYDWLRATDGRTHTVRVKHRPE